MKIAILTQPLGHNYGGILQNYALQNVLFRLGHHPVTIEQNPYQYISKLKLLFELPKRIITKYILNKREYILSEKHYNIYISQLRKLFPFVSKNIEHIYIEDFKSINIPKYDIIIVGSDQVWRPIYNRNCLDKMFLSFVPTTSKVKCIAYAASFGTKEWEYNEEQTKLCSDLIKRFNAVSTREDEGAQLCQTYLGYNGVVSVLDPTLLLRKNDYVSLCSNIKPQTNDIFFAYILDKNPSQIEMLEKLAKQMGLNLKLVSADLDCSVTVEEWIAMFRDARCVITDSFHGTIFSIIFNKEFYTIANQSRGGSRFISLLSQLALTDRIFYSISDITINKNIDWTIVNNKLEELKEYSINFLKTNIS